MWVNGMRTSRKTSVETRNPANSRIDPEELAKLVVLGRAEAVEAVGYGGDERPEGDERRSRARGCSSGRRGAPGRASGTEATKLTVIAIGEIRRLNRNWSPGWSGSSE